MINVRQLRTRQPRTRLPAPSPAAALNNTSGSLPRRGEGWGGGILSQKKFPCCPFVRPAILKTSPKSCIETLQCSILQHPKKMGEPGCQWLAGTQIRPRRAEITQFASFCGRWADLANFCSDRWFRSRAVVPLRLTGPSCLFRPRALLLCYALCPKRSS